MGPEERGELVKDPIEVQQDLDLLDQDPDIQIPSSLPNMLHKAIQPAQEPIS